MRMIIGSEARVTGEDRLQVLVLAEAVGESLGAERQVSCQI